MGAAETRRALAAAERALPAWKARTAKDRARVLRRLADLMLEHEDDLARLMVARAGQAARRGARRGRVRRVVLRVVRRGGEARLRRHRSRRRGRTSGSIVTKEPVGVTAGITPWNFPAAMPTRKSAPALAAGCTMVLKPAEQTPLSALAIAALAEEAGVPAGRLLRRDGRRRGRARDRRRDDRRTRSCASSASPARPRSGSSSWRSARPRLKKVSLELGGNAPFIVFDDADLDEAVAGAITCKFRNSGQTCISANRMLVQDGIYDDFLARVHRGRARRSRSRTGSPRASTSGRSSTSRRSRRSSGTSPTRSTRGAEVARRRRADRGAVLPAVRARRRHRRRWR